ncbi:MBL fold metallo-hydrolase [Galactobacter caseinivorans]|uniref:MBL fold metallo-hydrolase n=1 Tax=Galactobacter caseinivorans TaxID=2676123 RepID=A0A496PMX0_9MICC|nr:MBL fold metallo-hydrolase [Galactobacter caseinivorans]RKW71882.1 MBL fold metallo-hydrolase [Galactobacter caseinivorans]
MKLTIIGSTGSFPGPGSPASCYLLTGHDGTRPWRVLMDLGSGSLGVLQRYMDLKDIDAIFISHLHPDHCMDLCGLHVAVHWDPAGWGRDRVLVYGPSMTGDRMADAYGLPRDPGMTEDFDFRAFKNGETVKVGPFKVTPYDVRHPVEEAFALRVEATEKLYGETKTSVLTYSGDTDSCDGLVEAARDADLFLCEAAFQEGRDDGLDGVHLTGKRAGEAAREAGVHRMLLTHIPVWTDSSVVLQEARDEYEGELAVAVAGVTYGVRSGDRLSEPKTNSMSRIPVSLTEAIRKAGGQRHEVPGQG